MNRVEISEAKQPDTPVCCYGCRDAAAERARWANYLRVTAAKFSKCDDFYRGYVEAIQDMAGVIEANNDADIQAW